MKRLTDAPRRRRHVSSRGAWLSSSFFLPARSLPPSCSLALPCRRVGSTRRPRCPPPPRPPLAPDRSSVNTAKEPPVDVSPVPRAAGARRDGAREQARRDLEDARRLDAHCRCPGGARARAESVARTNRAGRRGSTFRSRSTRPVRRQRSRATASTRSSRSPSASSRSTTQRRRSARSSRWIPSRTAGYTGSEACSTRAAARPDGPTPGRDDDDDDAATMMTTWPSSRTPRRGARLVCGPNNAAVEALAPYLTRTMPRQNWPADLHVEIRPEPIRGPLGEMRGALPMLARSDGRCELRRGRVRDLVDAAVNEVRSTSSTTRREGSRSTR